MRSSVLNLYRAAKRRLQRVVRKSRDGEQVRRAAALLHLDRSGNVSETADSVAAARSSVYRWVSWFIENDVEGLRSQTPGRHLSTVTHEVVGAEAQGQDRRHEEIRCEQETIHQLPQVCCSGLWQESVREGAGVLRGALQGVQGGEDQGC